MRPNEPMPMYAPLATRQKPAKQRSRKAPAGERERRVPRGRGGASADDGASPDGEQRIWIVSEVGARDGQRMQDDAVNAAAAGPCAEDVAEFVDGLHGEPAGDEGGDQGEVGEGSHSITLIHSPEVAMTVMTLRLGEATRIPSRRALPQCRTPPGSIVEGGSRYLQQPTAHRMCGASRSTMWLSNPYNGTRYP